MNDNDNMHYYLVLDRGLYRYPQFTRSLELWKNKTWFEDCIYFNLKYVAKWL